MPSDEQKELWAREISEKQAQGESLQQAMRSTAVRLPAVEELKEAQRQADLLAAQQKMAEAEAAEQRRMDDDRKIAESARDEMQRIAAQRKAERMAWERGPDSYSAQRDRDIDPTFHAMPGVVFPTGRELRTALQGEWVTARQQLADLVQMLTLEGETDNVECFVGVRLHLSPARYASLKRILEHLMPDVQSAVRDDDTGNMLVTLHALVE